MVRIRLPELLEERGVTGYWVAKRSEGRIDNSAIYRLTRQRGRVRLLDSDLLGALCEVFGVGLHEILELE